MLTSAKQLKEILKTYKISSEYLEAGDRKDDQGRIIKSDRISNIITDILFGNISGMAGADIPENLSKLLSKKDKSFFEVLAEYIERSEFKKDSEVYKKAGISKAVFSRMRAGHIPSRINILRIILVLRLKRTEATHLLSYAGYSFKPDNKLDAFILFFLEEAEKGKIYDYDIMNIWCYECLGISLFGDE